VSEEVCPTCGASTSPETYTSRLLIVGEGLADQVFFRQLARHRGIPDLQAAGPAKGKDFTNRLEAMRGFAPETSTIVLVADSDSDHAASFELVRDQIRAVGDYGVPTRPLEVIKGRGAPAVAVLTLPWIDRNGNLETLLLDAMSEKSPTVRVEVDRLIAATVLRARGISKDSKARFACMVACICDDDPSCAASTMWYAAKGFQGLLDHKCFDPITDYLKSL